LHVRYGLDFPCTASSNSEFDRLTQLLLLPSLDQIMVEALESDHVRLNLAACGQISGLSLLHPTIYELVGLPKTYDILQEEAVRRRCPTSGRAVSDPALCLFCGEIFCSQSTCCITETVTGKKVGGCYKHRLKCGGNVGIFLLIRKCCILYLHNESGSWNVAPYLDKFGEVDPTLRTNMQLFLNQKRYDAILRSAWLQHQTPSIIARKLEGEVNIGGWESF